MKKLFVRQAACAGMWFFVANSAAGTDVFSGIYSIVDPKSGAEVDVMKIRRYADSYGVFSYLGGDEVQRGSLTANENDGSQPSPKVRVLSLQDAGRVYYVPDGADSPVGSSETGYISDINGLGNFPLKRRQLPREAERGINGKHGYVGKPDEQEVSFRVLNYSSKPLQLGISSVENKNNAVDTDPVNGNMASAFNCCFFLQRRWSDTARMNIEIRASDGKLHVTTLGIPKYGYAQNFEVAVNPDGHAEILFERSDRSRPLPRPPEIQK